MLDVSSVARHHRRFIALICQPLVLVALLLLGAMASFSGASMVDSAAAQPTSTTTQKPLNAKQRRLLEARLKDRLMVLQRDYLAGRKLVMADLERWTDDNPNKAVARLFDPKERPRPLPDGADNIYEAAIKDYVEARLRGTAWNPWPDNEKGADHQRDYARCVLRKIGYVFERKWRAIHNSMELLKRADPDDELRGTIRANLAFDVRKYLATAFPPIDRARKDAEKLHPKWLCPNGGPFTQQHAVNADPLSVKWNPECLPSDKDKRTSKIKPYHPTTAALMFDDGTGYTSYCSGTLIAPNAVLTAAHCVCDTGARDSNGEFYRTAGACVNGGYMRGRREFSTLEPKFQTVFFQHAGHFEISSVVVHPQFRWTDQLPISDLAILFLKAPVPDVAPMSINTVRKLPPNSDAVAVGYGAHNPISASGYMTDTGTVLETGGLKLQAKTKTAFCNLLQRKRNHICWRYEPTDRFGMRLGSTCRGDSGGPVYADFDGKTYLAGVVSGGGPSCEPTTRAFNIEVYAYRDWIQRQLTENPPPRGTNSSVVSAQGKDGSDGMRQFACHFCALCDQLIATVKTPPSFKTSAKASATIKTRGSASRILITANCTPDDITRRSERVKLTVSKESGGDNLCPKDPIIDKDPVVEKNVSTAVSCSLVDIGPEQTLHIKVESGLLQQCQIVATAFDASK